jgi:magnesium-transporting ATPase (P-type)
VVVVCVGNGETSSRREPEELDLSEESELQKKLKIMANNLTFIGMISALVILGATIVMLSIQLGVNDVFDWKLFLARLMDAITLTVILVIVAIPEGLPMVVTVSLAFCVKRMVENDGVLIKDVLKTEVLG